MFCYLMLLSSFSLFYDFGNLEYCVSYLVLLSSFSSVYLKSLSFV